MSKEENRFTWSPCVHVFKIILHQRTLEREIEDFRARKRDHEMEKERE